jgi:AraC family transcriptional regulator, transcriptional activator FtrA
MRPVAMRSCAIHDEQRGGWPLRKPFGDDFPVRQVKSTRKMSARKSLRASCIEQHKTRLVGANGLVHIPTVGFELKTRRKMSMCDGWIGRRNFGYGERMRASIHGDNGGCRHSSLHGIAPVVSHATMSGKKATAPIPLVAALVYDGLCTFEFGCVVELFSLNRPELKVPWYRFGVCALEHGPLRAAGGVSITAQHSLNLMDHASTIVIPGWRDADEPPPPALLRKLHAAHARGARLCSICSGVFVLAATGLLDGKAATTHWRYAEKLRRRFPKIEVRPNDLYVEAGNIVTAAGSAAGLDMMLHLVRRDYGARVANLVAQRLVIAPHREGGQAQYLPRPLPRNEGGPIAPLMDWVRLNPRHRHSLSSLARRAGMSPRTLQRHFQESVGLTPKAWLVRERVALAKEALEATNASLWKVAENAGFGSEESFRRHFRLVTGTSPVRYRQRFSADKR